MLFRSGRRKKPARLKPVAPFDRDHEKAIASAFDRDTGEPVPASSLKSYADTLSGADYLESVGKIHSYGREMAAFFTGWDMLLTATLAEPPAAIGRFAHSTEDYVNYRTGPGMVFDYSPFCAAFNASGQPAASLPLYWTAEGLPVGIQLAAGFGADEELIAVSAELEAVSRWADRRPPPVLRKIRT